MELPENSGSDWRNSARISSLELALVSALPSAPLPERMPVSASLWPPTRIWGGVSSGKPMAFFGSSTLIPGLEFPEGNVSLGSGKVVSVSDAAITFVATEKTNAPKTNFVFLYLIVRYNRPARDRPPLSSYE